MVSTILVWLSSLIISVISATGYFGVVFLMALESACLPVPSEIIMPFAGFLVFTGRFALWPVVLAGAVGNLIGSVAAYVIGFYGGRRLIQKYGKYILISEHDLEVADGWFKKYGQAAVFLGRVLPIVRTYISLPAGITRMDFKKFCFYTLLGSILWAFILTYAGILLGENWEGLKVHFRQFDIAVGISIVLGVAWWTWHHFKRRKIVA